MSQPESLTPGLDESALQALVDLLDATHPNVASAAFRDVDAADAAVFFVLATRLKGNPTADALAKHAGTLFAALPFETQVSIAEKVATLETVESEAAMQIWNDQIARIQAAIQKTTFLGEGPDNLATLLGFMELTEQDAVLAALGERQPTLVQSVSEQLFAFEDLENLEDTGITTILQVLDTPTLALALHDAPESVKDRFFENMSASQAEAVTAETEQLTFEQTQIAETARRSVVTLVRNFAAKGLLKIR